MWSYVLHSAFTIGQVSRRSVGKVEGHADRLDRQGARRQTPSDDAKPEWLVALYCICSSKALNLALSV